MPARRKMAWTQSSTPFESPASIDGLLWTSRITSILDSQDLHLGDPSQTPRPYPCPPEYTQIRLRQRSPYYSPHMPISCYQRGSAQVVVRVLWSTKYALP